MELLDFNMSFHINEAVNDTQNPFKEKKKTTFLEPPQMNLFMNSLNNV